MAQLRSVAGHLHGQGIVGVADRRPCKTPERPFPARASPRASAAVRAHLHCLGPQFVAHTRTRARVSRSVQYRRSRRLHGRARAPTPGGDVRPRGGPDAGGGGAHAAIPISHRGCASLSSARYPAGAPLLDLRIEPAHKQAERRPFREQHRGSVSAPSRATSPAIEKRNRAGYSSAGRDRPSTPTRAALWSRLDGSPRTGLLRLRRPAF